MVSAPIIASRTRQRLEHVFNWAITSGHRVDNPAGKHILSALPMSTRETNHHESLPYGDVPLVLSQPPNNNYPNRLAEGRSKAIGPTLRFQTLPISRLTEY